MELKLAAHILDSLYNAGPEILIRERWPSEIARTIASHSSLDRRAMTGVSHRVISCEVDDSEVTLRINLRTLQEAIDAVERTKSARALEDEYLRKGASNACMNVLFGLSKEESIYRRKLLGCPQQKKGKVSPTKALDIAHLWSQLKKTIMHPRAIILEIHEQTQEPIVNIWNVINTSEVSPGTLTSRVAINSIDAHQARA